MARTLIGKVASNAMDKTVVVLVEGLKSHPIYKKQYKTTVRFQAHDETNKIEVGTMVEITECRPMSRHKHFIVSKVLASDAPVVKASKKTAAKKEVAS
ncbi:30S ribosomal protein S17 [Candidatus Saccharibacteria bacterium]|nr:30S ribosomal protein S17 [Candidatus Saccharibacteria bacterium]